MARQPTPEATSSEPHNQEPGTDSQDDRVFWSNDDENESKPEEKSEESDGSDSETHSNVEEIGENEPERSSSKSSSTNSNERVAADVSGTLAKEEIKTMDDTNEVDEFTNTWRKVFLGDLDMKMSDNVKIVRIFTSSTFTGIISKFNKLFFLIVYPRSTKPPISKKKISTYAT